MVAWGHEIRVCEHSDASCIQEKSRKGIELAIFVNIKLQRRNVKTFNSKLF